MAEYAIDVTKTRKLDWNVIFDTAGIGLVDAVDPTKLKMVYKELKAGTTGDVVLSDRFVALNGSIDVDVRQITVAQITKLCPWFPHATPPVGKLLYDYAKKLVLHPSDLPDTDKTEDIGFWKAVPMTGYMIKRDGEKEDVWKVSFAIYPDHAKLVPPSEDSPYGWIGAEPT